MSKKNYSIIAIVGLLVFTAATFFIRCYYRELSGDEVIYQYVWEIDDPIDLWHTGHRFERKVSSLNDIIQTQTIHYFKGNGRVLLHGIEQAFTNHMICFSIINSAVFILLICLCVFYIAPNYKTTRSYPLWLGTTICLLYFFPYKSSLWTSPNLGLNYLWPSTMSLLFLLLWKKIQAHRVSKLWNGPIVLFSILFGLTHESFVISLAGASVIYYLFNFRNINDQLNWLFFPLWLSSPILIFAPSNLNRFSNQNNSIFFKILNGIDNTLHLFVFWALIILIFYILIKYGRTRLKTFITSNLPIFITFIIAFLFSLIAHSEPYSHTMVELSAMLILLSYISTETRILFNLKNYISISITAIYIISQLIIDNDTINIFKIQHQQIQKYLNSDSTVIIDSVNNPSFLARPFIRPLDDRRLCIFASLRKDKDPLMIVSPYEKEALSNPNEFYIINNKVLGNAPVYKSVKGRYYWVHPDSINSISRLEAELHAVDWFHKGPFYEKILFLKQPEKYPNKQLLEIDTLHTQFGIRYRIKPLEIRKIKAINMIG